MKSGVVMDHAPEGERGSPCSGMDRQSIHSPPPALPMNWGSQQWRLMRRAIRGGATIEEAAEAGDMPLKEAALLAEIDAKRAPLPDEAFTLLYDPAARAAQPAKEPEMADNDDDEVIEVAVMDFAGAKRIYHADIAPEKTQAASHMQEVGEAYKVIKRSYGIQPQAAKVAFKIFEMEEAHGEDFLRCLAGLVNEMFDRKALTFHGGDLVDMAENLAADLEGASDIFEEASEEELAAQTTRPSVEKAKAEAEKGAEEPKPGTGAAARRKMKDSAPAESAPALH